MSIVLIQRISLYCFLLYCITLSDVYAENATEHYAKAVFLFKVIDFVVWPDNIRNNNNLTKVCVFGDDPFNNSFQEIVNKKKKENSVSLRYTQDLKDITDCHIIYIGKSEKYRISNVIKYLKHKPILTVSDIKKFAYKKGMIELGVHHRKRKLEIRINLTSVNESGIKLSSNLIELATDTYGDLDKGKSQ